MKALIVSLIALAPLATVHADHHAAAEKATKIAMFTNVVKADKTGDFEAFVDAFRKGVSGLIETKKLNAAEAKAYEGFRVIKQAGAGGDTVTYHFVMDPFIPESSYGLGDYLKRAYGAEKSAVLLVDFRACLAAPQQPFMGEVLPAKK